MEEHLENITLDGFKKWIKMVAFLQFASSTNANGSYQIGVNGQGMSVVVVKTISGKTTSYYNKPREAIEAYNKYLKS